MRSSFFYAVPLLAVAGMASSGGLTERPAPTPVAAAAKIDPWVAKTAAAGPAEFLVFLSTQADVRGAEARPTKRQKGRFVFNRLTEVARRTQGPLLELLASRGVEHQPFWIANMIWVRGERGLVQELAARPDVARIHANPWVPLERPREDGAAARVSVPDKITWGLMRVRALDVWADGFTGQGVVVAGADTGYEWDHVALQASYRGWSGTSADHNYHWHDAIHSGGGVCGANSQEPCDDDSHGTHTMGTMVGDGGPPNRIGVAPGARWIGCRNMNQGNGTPTTYAECFQWFMAPTDLANQNPDPARAPHVINNSWSCPSSEGCTDPNVLRTVVENTRAAGILVVVSAGNAGSGCSSVNTPAAIYDASFSVGATGSSLTDAIANFSSRGPVTVDGSNRMKPNVSAPGVGIRSSIPGNRYASFSGTSMAGPHVVGVAALLMSADPSLRGQVGMVESILESTAVARTSAQACGGVPGTQIPNNTFGFGRVDAYAAVHAGDLTARRRSR